MRTAVRVLRGWNPWAWSADQVFGRDVFISMNVPGIEAFNSNPKMSYDAQSLYGNGIGDDRQPKDQVANPSRTPAGKAVEIEEPNRGPENVNVFDELQNLRIGLLTGDLESIRNTLERFDQIYGKIVATRSKIGSRIQGLQSANSAMERHNLTNANLSSNLEDADMAQVVSDLAKEETVFRSSLESSKRLIQPTLMDFLR